MYIYIVCVYIILKSLLRRAQFKVEELEEKLSSKELSVKQLQLQLEESIHERVELEDSASTALVECKQVRIFMILHNVIVIHQCLV